LRRIIAVIDPDSEYAQKLAEYINRHDFGGLRAVTFSGADSFKRLEESYDTRMMLIDENEVTRLYEGSFAPGAGSGSPASGTKPAYAMPGSEDRYFTICLSEDSFAATHYVTINKYSSAEAIVRFMLAKYAEVSKDVLTRTSINRSHVISVYSPVGRCGKTSFAITVAQYLGRDCRCLMLSLDEYSGVFRHIADGAESDMSDVIYAYKQGKYSWAGLAQIVCRFGNMDYIPPARYPEDISVLTGDQMADLLDKISMESGYENIILDLGAYGKKAAEILEMSNEVLMPVLESSLCMCKVEEFREILNESGRGEIIGRIKTVKLPFEERFENTLTREEDYSYGKLFEYTRNLFNDTGQSDQAADGYAQCQ